MRYYEDMSKKTTHILFVLYGWMVHKMLDSLITSKTRIKLLLKFFANPDTTAYLRSLAEEFGESTNSVRVELNRLADANLLTSRDEGRTKVYQANRKHQLFPEIYSLVRKYLGLDQLVEQIEAAVSSLGDVKAVYLVGDYARGIDSGIIDVCIIGLPQQNTLDYFHRRAEILTKRKVNIEIMDGLPGFLEKKSLLLWEK